jgi:N-[(2S)-2-amino-2-carboxyethyl]-L-glutamate dehydrogenase
MRDGDILILKSHDVAALLDGRESVLIDVVRQAYETHGRGESSLPHSAFLRFSPDLPNRIIALPAYLGQQFEVAGIKWVASFPGNIDQGLDRASAIVVLNSTHTGRAEAIIEGSLISARRTAASAALAAQCLIDGKSEMNAGIIGCGLINFEVVRFLRSVCRGITTFIVCDLDKEHARRFRRRCEMEFADIRMEFASDVNAVLRQCLLVSIATTATEPHIFDLSPCAPGSTLLHISLRDLAPEAILRCDNIVDDIDHVCRAQTSIHLAEQLTGNRDFVRCTLADILSGKAKARKSPESVAVFSPFGLGILDVAVGQLVRTLGLKHNVGTIITSFLNGRKPNGYANEAGDD